MVLACGLCNGFKCLWEQKIIVGLKHNHLRLAWVINSKGNKRVFLLTALISYGGKPSKTKPFSSGRCPLDSRAIIFMAIVYKSGSKQLKS